MEKKVSSIIFWLCTAALITGGVLMLRQTGEVAPSSVLKGIPEVPLVLEEPIDREKTPGMASPLRRASERVTKKSFGLYINRAMSPVQPERFEGYHTGTDFEVFPDEVTAEVVVAAICDGEIVAKRPASGYGGLLVTHCLFDNQAVTVLYGHLALSTITLQVGEKVTSGERIGLLGAAESSDTDGERKHLHLGIHLGDAVNILGYVKRKQDLSGWFDPCPWVCGR